jgi:hypothetical protein
VDVVDPVVADDQVGLEVENPKLEVEQRLPARVALGAGVDHAHRAVAARPELGLEELRIGERVLLDAPAVGRRPAQAGDAELSRWLRDLDLLTAEAERVVAVLLVAVTASRYVTEVAVHLVSPLGRIPPHGEPSLAEVVEGSVEQELLLAREPMQVEAGAELERAEGERETAQEQQNLG